MKSFFENWRKHCLIKNPLTLPKLIENNRLPRLMENKTLPPLIQNNPGKHLTMRNPLDLV